MRLERYDCLELEIPESFRYKESTYGSQKNLSNVSLASLAFGHKRITFARSICINSSNYSILNFLIIPNPNYNMPFLGLDFVTLPKYHLLVLDFQPSINFEKQFNNRLLSELLILKQACYEFLPFAGEMSSESAKFFSPGLIWSKLPLNNESDILISKILYKSFQDYLNLYLKVLFRCETVDPILKNEIITGQCKYLEYRKDKDPARPMLSNLFGRDFTEDLIHNFLFNVGKNYNEE